jgi:hypothetical protein
MSLATPSSISYPASIVNDGTEQGITITGQRFLASGGGSTPCTFSIRDAAGVAYICTTTSSTDHSVTGTYKTTSTSTQIQVTVTNTSGDSSSAGVTPWVTVAVSAITTR